MSGKIPPEAIKAALELVVLVGDAIKESGKQGIISGHLYAILMTTGMSLELYNKVISKLKEVGLVEERNNVLYWTQES